MIWLIQTIQYRIWPPRPSLEYLLNYKIFSGFPSLDKAAKDFTGPVSQQLVPDSLLRLEAMQINFHIFQGSCISKSSILGGQDKTIFNRKSSEVRREKTSIVFDKLDISNEEDFCHRLYIFFFTVIWTQTAGFVTASHRSLEFPVVSSFAIFDELGTASTDVFIIWHFSLFTVMMELRFRKGM